MFLEIIKENPENDQMSKVSKRFLRQLRTLIILKCLNILDVCESFEIPNISSEFVDISKMCKNFLSALENLSELSTCRTFQRNLKRTRPLKIG